MEFLKQRKFHNETKGLDLMRIGTEFNLLSGGLCQVCSNEKPFGSVC